MGQKEEYKMVATNEGSNQGPNFTAKNSRRRYIIIGVVFLAVLVVLAIILGVYFGVTSKDKDRQEDHSDEATEPPPEIKADSSFELLLTLDKDYSSDYDYPETQEYQTLQKDAEDIIDDILRNSSLKEWYIRNTVTGFRPGSVVVLDKVDFKARDGLSIVWQEITSQVKKGLGARAARAEALKAQIDKVTVDVMDRTGNVKLGESCSEDNDCSDKNSECSPPLSPAAKCRCLDGFYDSNYDNTTGGRCSRLLSYGQSPCREPRHCRTTGVACNEYHQCLCNPTTHKLKNDACELYSEQASFCPRSVSDPNAVLGTECTEDLSLQYCRVRCKDGFRLNNVESEFRIGVTIYCRDGKWATSDYNQKLGYGVSNLCLPEADFRRCQMMIPHGELRDTCGVDSDWLCRFDCYDGYWMHKFMTGQLKELNDYDYNYKLHCDNGTWKTGFEDVGLDVSGVCIPSGKNCTDAIPNGEVDTPCRSGFYCRFDCNPGYRAHVLISSSWPYCLNGVWQFRASKDDPTITPDNACIPEDSVSDCSPDIPNGSISSDCKVGPVLQTVSRQDKVNCWPTCDEGFHVPRDIGSVTCVKGKWLTKYAPYTGDNICFPNDGYTCPQDIPNGMIGGTDAKRFLDTGDSRLYVPYVCNQGYRQHRAMRYLECVAGKWVTWQERFNFDVNDLCIPFNQN